jgi:hypothetical protein
MDAQQPDCIIQSPGQVGKVGSGAWAPWLTGFVSGDFCQSPQLPHPFLRHKCNETGNRHPEVMSGDSSSKLKQIAVSRSR